MQAYEFFAKPQNGVIPIPEQYRNIIKNSVKVIVLEKEPFRVSTEDSNVRNKTDILSPPDLKTKGWKFSREEANER